MKIQQIFQKVEGSVINMKSVDLREKYLSFFEGKGHKRLPSSSLIPENDPTVLFTTAGMQQFKRYYLFPDEAPATRVVTCQKCVRTGDIEEVGDPTHVTMLEMLGNFSFGYPKHKGAYFKEEAIQLAWKFLTQELKVDKSRVYATYFTGENGVPADEESLRILKTIDGLDDIRPQGFEDNFWSLGTEGSPGGPCVEFYIDSVEVWNLVFNEYVMKDGVYELSDIKGIDTGMGLERLVAKMNNVESVYLTDLFELEHKKLHDFLSVESPIDERIVLDHIRAAVFMINDGIEPSNKGQGYILRRLIRRAVVKARNLKINSNFASELADGVFDTFPNYEFKKDKIKSELKKEESKFRLTLESGLKLINSQTSLSGRVLFDLHQTFGIPLEVALEEIQNTGKTVDPSSIEEFHILSKEHQDKSRTASAGMFKGGLADNKIETTRLHTAAHLLLAALRHELNPDIEQKGSNITEERLRFDFNFPEKLTDEQIKKIEDLVNLKIEESLPVTMQELSIEEAKKSGATGSFHDKYGDTVKIFNIGNLEEPFSREICGGPHVENTSELGHFKITKEESSSAGVRRIKAILN
jgi:alanyl-tRNA synthetase